MSKGKILDLTPSPKQQQMAAADAMIDQFKARVEKEESAAAKRLAEAAAERAEKLVAYREKNVAPPGEIPNIPPLLEARRLKYGIPDAFFASQPCNNRINVFQLDADEGETYGEGPIVKPEIAQQRSLEQTPKGILLGGGLKAMDHMYANGYWIGHVINFVCLNPWRKPIANLDGHDLHVLVMTCGDVTDSDDLASYMRAGKVRHAKREFTLTDGMPAHEFYLQDTETGGVWDPSKAEMLEEEANEG
jgi:hypothetical protein